MNKILKRTIHKKLKSYIRIAKSMSKEAFYSEFICDFNSEEALNLAKKAYKIVYKNSKK